MSDPVSIFRSSPSYRLHPPSETLINALRMVSDMTADDGAPRHSTQRFNRLVSLIAGKSFSPSLYVCCHFLSLSAISGHLLHEWLLSPTTLNLSHLARLVDLPADSSWVSRDGQAFNWHDSNKGADKGEIRFRSNLPELLKSIALLDFMVEVLGYDTLAEAYDALRDSQSSHDIGQISNQLGRALYEYLTQQLPSTHSQSKYALFTSFLSEQEIDPTAPEAITDTLILEFWTQTAGDENAKMRLYRVCAESWARYQQAIRLSTCHIFSQNIPTAEEFDLLANLSEDDVDHYVNELDHQNGLENNLDMLRRANYDGIKLLTGRELDQIDPLRLTQDPSPLALSALRVAHFSPVQAKLVEALRKKKSARDRHGMIDTLTSDEGYDDHIAKWENISKTCLGVGAAACHWLIENRQAQILAALPVLLAPDEQEIFDECLAQARQEMTQSWNGPRAVDRIEDDIFDHFMAGFSEKGGAILTRLKKAAQTFRRQGLKPDAAQSAELTIWANTVLEGTQSLAAVARFMDQYLGRLKSLSEPLLAHQYPADFDIFSTHFKKLYT